MGGFEAEAIGWHGQHYSAEVTLPPLAALWLVPEANDDVRAGAAAKAVASRSRSPRPKAKAKAAAKKKPAAKKKAAAKKKPAA